MKENIDTLYSILSDIHKDAYGFRPRGMYRDDLTEEELYDEIDRLSVVAQRVADEERAEELRCRERFEAKVSELIEMGAGDRETAVRWLIDSMGNKWHDMDRTYFNYEWNLGYDYDYYKGVEDPAFAHMR